MPSIARLICHPFRSFRGGVRRLQLAKALFLDPALWDRLLAPPACLQVQSLAVSLEPHVPLNPRTAIFYGGNREPLYDTIREIVDDRCYLPADILARLGEHSTIVDIGANVGVFSVSVALLTGARVIAVEPVPENIHWLRRNIAENKATNVQVVEKAVAARAQSSTMAVCALSVGARLSSGPVSAGPPPITVQTVTLPGLLAEAGVSRVDLLKMDCEGSEYQIFSSMQSDDFARIGAIAMEFHEQGANQTGSVLAQRLQSEGFSVELQPSRYRRELGFIIARRPLTDAWAPA